MCILAFVLLFILFWFLVCVRERKRVCVLIWPETKWLECHGIFKIHQFSPSPLLIIAMTKKQLIRLMSGQFENVWFSIVDFWAHPYWFDLQHRVPFAKFIWYFCTIFLGLVRRIQINISQTCGRRSIVGLFRFFWKYLLNTSKLVCSSS